MTRTMIMVAMASLAFGLGYSFSRFLVAAFMTEIGYELSLSPPIKYARLNNRNTDGTVDDETAQQTIAMNKQARILLTLVLYAALVVVVLFLRVGQSDSAMTMVLSLLFLGLLLSCVLTINSERRSDMYILRFVRYEGSTRKPVFEVLFSDGDESELSLNADDIKGVLYKDEILIAFMLPTGDFIYDWLLL